MDNNNINNGDEAEAADNVTEAQAEAQAIQERDQQLFSLLNQKDDLPVRTRNKFNELVKALLDPLENDVHEMLCDQNVGNIYQGLDSERDTVKEVKTILQIFPNTISKRKDVVWGEQWNEDGEAEEGWVAAGDGEGEYPIQCAVFTIGTNGYCCNFKAISFVAILAQAAKELDQFEEQQRGGLLYEDENGLNTLHYLARMSHSSNEEELNQRVDIVCLSQLIQLRRMDLLEKDDIPEYNLVRHAVCCSECQFSENRLRFLVEWCPASLVHINEYGWLPLHHAANKSTIAIFRTVFEYLIRYYPTKKGIISLFTKNNDGMTPFQMARREHVRDIVMTIIEDTLNNSVIQINIEEALVMAAINGNVDLDCVYFLSRREPEWLLRLIPLGPNNNNNNNVDVDDGGGNHNDSGDNDNDRGHDDDHVDDNDEGNDNDNDIDDNEDMNDVDGDGDDDDDTEDDDDDDDRKDEDEDEDEGECEGEEGDGDEDEDEDEMGDSTNNNTLDTRKRKR